MKLLLSLIVRKRDPRTDRIRAARITQRSRRLIDDNRAVLDDIRRMERGLTE